MSSIIKPVLGSQLNFGHPLANGLAGCWLFNEGSGGQVFDLSGNGQTATEQGDSVWVPGKFGSARYFSGDDYLEFTPKKQHTGDFTVVMSLNPTDLSAGKHFFSAGYNTDPSWMIYYEGNEIRFIENDGGVTVYDGINATLAIGIEQQLTVTRRGTALNVYVNGIWVGSDIVGGASGSGGNYHIGWSRPRDSATAYYKGDIGYTTFYNHALFASEIALLYREPFCMLERRARIALMSGYAVPPVGMAGAMTTNSGYWGW